MDINMTIYDYIFIVTAVAGIATYIATKTPTKKDDAFMVKVNKFIKDITNILTIKKK